MRSGVRILRYHAFCSRILVSPFILDCVPEEVTLMRKHASSRGGFFAQKVSFFRRFPSDTRFKVKVVRATIEVGLMMLHLLLSASIRTKAHGDRDGNPKRYQ